MLSPRFLPLCFLAALTACSAPQVVTQAKLDHQVAVTGGTYKKVGGGITVATELKEINGQTGVCGVWAETPDLHAWVRGSGSMQLLPSSAAYLNGHRLVTNLQFLQKVDPAQDYRGLTGNCALSDMPWQAGYAQMAPEVRIPKQMVYEDIDDDSGAGIIIMFEQTGPGA